MASGTRKGARTPSGETCRCTRLPEAREFSSGGLVVSRYAASVRAAQACKALHAARRKAVEKRINEASEDSSGSGEASASRRSSVRVLQAVTNRTAPRRVRRLSDATSICCAVQIVLLLQPAEKTARSDAARVKRSRRYGGRERATSRARRHKQRNTTEKSTPVQPKDHRKRRWPPT